jgi:hypothetical protein
MKKNHLKPYIEFFTDKWVIRAFLVILGIELILQFGLWSPLLKKNSFASNISRIIDHTTSQIPNWDPNAMILGTSIAFEGISLPQLNDTVKETGFEFQSLAVPGSELIVQDLVVEKHLPKFKKVKILFHVMDLGLPWNDRKELIQPTLVMLSEMGNFRSISKVYEYEYVVKPIDIITLLSKTVAYKHDIADFFKEPNERIKFWGRKYRTPNQNYWDYDNVHPERVSAYKVHDLSDCFENIKLNDASPIIPPDSSPRHREDLYKTCVMAKELPEDFRENETTKKYFKRLNMLYDRIRARDIKIVHVFAPIHESLHTPIHAKKMALWHEELKRLNGGVEPEIIDLQEIFVGKDSGYYTYDLIHLNESGKHFFTEAFSREILKRYPNGLSSISK